MRRQNVSYLLVLIMLFSIPVCCWAYSGKKNGINLWLIIIKKSNVEGDVNKNS